MWPLLSPPRLCRRVRSEKYVAQFFAGTETAGLFRRRKEDELRELVSMGFFRLTPPPGFALEQMARHASGFHGEATLFPRIDQGGIRVYSCRERQGWHRGCFRDK